MLFCKKILLLFLLLTYIHSELIEIDIEKETHIIQAETTKVHFKVHFSLFEQAYLKVLASPKDQTSAQLFFSTQKEEVNRENAMLLATEEGNNVMYINRGFFSFQNDFFLTVNCVQKCDFTLHFEFHTAIELEKGESYSFITRGYDINGKNAFWIMRNDERDILSISVTGGLGDDAEMSVFYGDEQIKDPDGALYNGDIVTFDEKNYNGAKANYYILNVNSTENTYVTVSSRVVNKVTPVLANQPAIYGMLNKTILSQECFDFVPSSTTGHSVNYEISVLAKNSIVQVDFMNTSKEVTKTFDVSDQKSVIFSSADEDGRNICFSSKYEPTAVFSFQITDLDNLDTKYAVYQPQINGIAYTHHLNMGQFAYYRHSKYSKNRKETNYNMKVIKGDPIMYVHTCETFPNCVYNEATIQRLDLHPPHDINDFFTYTVRKSTEYETTEVSMKQTLLIVKCGRDSKASEDCEFEISFFDDKDYMTLKADNRFSQFIMPNEDDKYTFTVTDPNAKKVIINLYTISGDSYLDVELEPSEPEYKHYVGSKDIIEYINEGAMGKGVIGTYKVHVKSTTNSFYTIYYTVVTKEKDDVVNIPSGMLVLETLKNIVEGEKTFVIEHKKKRKGAHYLATFFSYNCVLNVKFKYTVDGVAKEKKLPVIDNLVQHELSNGEEGYAEDSFNYQVAIESMDQNVPYSQEMCMFYIAAQEFTVDQDLVIPEGNPTQLTLNKVMNEIKYVYPIADTDGDVILNFILEDEAVITVTPTLNEEKTLSTEQFSRSKQIRIDKEDISDACKERYNVCNLQIKVSIDKQGDYANGVQFELTVRSAAKYSIPTYLKKGVLKQEATTVNHPQYFYSDIYPNEEGKVKINFNRGSANVYARIVRKDIVEEKPDYNGKYVLPKATSKDLLNYNPYTRTISYTKADTSKCEKGCDILIAIDGADLYYESIVIDALVDFSIFIEPTVSTMAKTQSAVDIPANQFVFGHLDKTIADSVYDYYTFWVPNDADDIIIELQCKVCNVYVNEGDNVITNKDKSKFSFKATGKNQILKISKLKTSFDNLKDQPFTIAIAANAIDEIEYTRYALRLRAPKKDYPDVIEIDADQQSTCEIDIDDGYCNFLVPLDDFDTLTSLFIHSYAEDSEAELTIYEKKVNALTFDMASPSAYKTMLPVKGNSDFSSESSATKDSLWVLQQFSKNEYILISVRSTKRTVISVLTTFKTSFRSTFPNPNAVQLFIVRDNEPMNLIIPKQYAYSVQLTSVFGSAYVGLTDTTRGLIKGQRDTITMTTSGKENEVVRIESPIDGNPIFAFYIEYKRRPMNQNFDEFEYGTSGDVIYESDFPIVFYSMVTGTDDVNVAINFKALRSKNATTDNFTITGYVTDEDTVIKRKNNSTVIPSSKPIVGQYIQGIKTAHVTFKKSELNAANVKYMFVVVDKAENNTNVYEKIHTEVSMLPVNNKAVVFPAGQYNYGYLQSEFEGAYLYQMKRDLRTENILRIEFAAFDNAVNFAVLDIEEDKNLYENSKEINIAKNETKYGKTTIEVHLKDNQDKVLLSVFTPGDHKVTNETRTNFIFRYNVSSVEMDTAKIDSTKVESSYANETLTLKFKSIVTSKDQVIPATYYAYLIHANQTNDIESSSLVLPSNVEYESSFFLINNEDKDITFTIKGAQYDKYSYYYIKLVGVTSKDNVYFGYDPVFDPFNYKKPSSSLPGWAIVLIVIFLAVVIGGIVLVDKFLKRKKDMKENVEKASFIGSGDQNKNLLSNEQDLNLNSVV